MYSYIRLKCLFWAGFLHSSCVCVCLDCRAWTAVEVLLVRDSATKQMAGICKFYTSAVFVHFNEFNALKPLFSLKMSLCWDYAIPACLPYKYTIKKLHQNTHIIFSSSSSSSEGNECLPYPERSRLFLLNHLPFNPDGRPIVSTWWKWCISVWPEALGDKLPAAQQQVELTEGHGSQQRSVRRRW